MLDGAAFGAATPVVPSSCRHPNHALGGRDLGLPDDGRRLDVHDDRVVEVDEVVGSISEVGKPPSAPVQRAAGSERSRERFDLYPARLAGDSGYGSAAMLGWLVYDQGIEPHIPVFDKSVRKDGTFSREDFTYDPEGRSTGARPVTP